MKTTDFLKFFTPLSNWLKLILGQKGLVECNKIKQGANKILQDSFQGTVLKALNIG